MFLLIQSENLFMINLFPKFFSIYKKYLGISIGVTELRHLFRTDFYDHSSTFEKELLVVNRMHTSIEKCDMYMIRNENKEKINSVIIICIKDLKNFK